MIVVDIGRTEHCKAGMDILPLGSASNAKMAMYGVRLDRQPEQISSASGKCYIPASLLSGHVNSARRLSW